MTLEEAKAEIRDVIIHAGERGFYPEERRRIDAALAVLRSHARGDDHHHILELQQWIDVFASPRKGDKYGGGYQQVRVWILGCLDKIGWETSPPQQ